MSIRPVRAVDAHAVTMKEISSPRRTTSTLGVADVNHPSNVKGSSVAPSRGKARMPTSRVTAIPAAPSNRVHGGRPGIGSNDG